MKNKVIITAVIAALITSQTATVFGASLSNVGDTQSRETLASFDATASDLGGVIVSVPEKITLTKDSNDTFKDSDYVTAYGQIGADVRLRVTASESIEYTNKDVEDATKVTGIVDFGTKYWSSDELFQGYKDHDNAVKNAVTISIADMSSMQPGEYDGSVPFEIELEKIDDSSVTETLDNSNLVVLDTGSSTTTFYLNNIPLKKGYNQVSIKPIFRDDVYSMRPNALFSIDGGLETYDCAFIKDDTFMIYLPSSINANNAETGRGLFSLNGKSDSPIDHIESFEITYSKKTTSTTCMQNSTAEIIKNGSTAKIKITMNHACDKRSNWQQISLHFNQNVTLQEDAPFYTYGGNGTNTILLDYRTYDNPLSSSATKQFEYTLTCDDITNLELVDFAISSANEN